jgi:hypothetical protein
VAIIGFTFLLALGMQNLEFYNNKRASEEARQRIAELQTKIDGTVAKEGEISKVNESILTRVIAEGAKLGGVGEDVKRNLDEQQKVLLKSEGIASDQVATLANVDRVLNPLGPVRVNLQLSFNGDNTLSPYLETITK